MIDTDKINDVAAEGIVMLWEHVESRYPNAESGDLSPPMAMALEAAVVNAVNEWVCRNVPDEPEWPGVTSEDVAYAVLWRDLDKLTLGLNADDQDEIVRLAEEGLSKFNEYKDATESTFADISRRILLERLKA